MLARPFFVIAYPECLSGNDAARRIPPHKLLIEPLVAVADEIVVFQQGASAVVPIPPHSVVRRKQLRLDPAQVLVRGWESFWNAGAWERGAVTLRLDRSSIDWSGLFLWTQYGGVWSSRRQLRKGTPESAVQYCDAHAVGSTVVVSLSASNGIEWMEIWSDPSHCQHFDALAQRTCRHFVRECEVGKFAREIVYDSPEYQEMV